MKINQLADDINRYLSVPIFTEQEHTFFDTEKINESRTTQGTYLRIEVNYELSMDSDIVARSIFTYFDALGNTGGINSILTTIATILVAFVNQNSVENYLAEQLY